MTTEETNQEVVPVKMTLAQRREMFAKDYLDLTDLTMLLGICYTRASEIVREIKFNTRDRLHTRGRVHVQDYLDYYGLDPKNYYRFSAEDTENDEPNAGSKERFLSKEDQKKCGSTRITKD